MHTCSIRTGIVIQHNLYLVRVLRCGFLYTAFKKNESFKIMTLIKSHLISIASDVTEKKIIICIVIENNRWIYFLLEGTK